MNPRNPLKTILVWGLMVGTSSLLPAPMVDEPAPAPAPVAQPAAVPVPAPAPVPEEVPPPVDEAALDWDHGVQVDPDLQITMGNDPALPYGVF